MFSYMSKSPNAKEASSWAKLGNSFAWSSRKSDCKENNGGVIFASIFEASFLIFLMLLGFSSGLGTATNVEDDAELAFALCVGLAAAAGAEPDEDFESDEELVT